MNTCTPFNVCLPLLIEKTLSLVHGRVHVSIHWWKLLSVNSGVEGEFSHNSWLPPPPPPPLPENRDQLSNEQSHIRCPDANLYFLEPVYDRTWALKINLIEVRICDLFLTGLGYVLMVSCCHDGTNLRGTF